MPDPATIFKLRVGYRLPQVPRWDIVPVLTHLPGLRRAGVRLASSPAIRKYVTEETYSRASYLDLLSTYSGHRTLSYEARQGLFDCVGSLIDKNFGGQVRKAYLNQLIIARKA